MSDGISASGKLSGEHIELGGIEAEYHNTVEALGCGCAVIGGLFRFAHLRYLPDIGPDPPPLDRGEARGRGAVWGEGVFGIGSFAELFIEGF